jgi:hypothetical protein
VGDVVTLAGVDATFNGTYTVTATTTTTFSYAKVTQRHLGGCHRHGHLDRTPAGRRLRDGHPGEGRSDRMRVRVNYNDGTEPEELDVTPGSVHFHPYPEGDTEKHEVTVETVGVDPLAADEPEPDVEYADEEGYDPVITRSPKSSVTSKTTPRIWMKSSPPRGGQGRVTLLTHLESMRES